MSNRIVTVTGLDLLRTPDDTFEFIALGRQVVCYCISNTDVSTLRLAYLGTLIVACTPVLGLRTDQFCPVAEFRVPLGGIANFAYSPFTFTGSFIAFFQPNANALGLNMEFGTAFTS